MNIHGCSIIASVGEALFYIQVLEEILHDIPLSMEDFIMRNMDDHILYGSERKGLYSSMDWMGRYITEMETKGCASLAHIGKSFLCICSKFIDAYDIALSCEKNIRNVWHPFDALGTQNSKDWMSRDMLELSTPIGITTCSLGA